MMPVQRTRMLRTGEKQVVKCTAGGYSQKYKIFLYPVFCNVRHTSVAGDMLVSR